MHTSPCPVRRKGIFFFASPPSDRKARHAQACICIAVRSQTFLGMKVWKLGEELGSPEPRIGKHHITNRPN